MTCIYPVRVMHVRLVMSDGAQFSLYPKGTWMVVYFSGASSRSPHRSDVLRMHFADLSHFELSLQADHLYLSM